MDVGVSKRAWTCPKGSGPLNKYLKGHGPCLKESGPLSRCLKGRGPLFV